MKPPLRPLQLLPKTTLLVFVSLFFSFNIFAQPSNDNCSNAINRTSSTNCNNNGYDLQNATASAGLPVGCESGGVHYDVWFRFTATNATHSIAISSLESGITNPEIQLYSGSCGTPTSLVCGTTSLVGTGLTVGNTYYVRVSNVGAAVTSNGEFDICVTHPGTPPTNDECAGAILLTSNTSCNNSQYTLRYATASAGIPVGCASAGLHFDTWFSFIAAGTTQTVAVSGLGSNITNPELQLFSGGCGSLTSLMCGTTTLTATGLTIGNTYYVRVSNIGSWPTSNNNSRFDICVSHPNPPPANDNCSGATVLTSNPAPTCNNITSNLRFATNSAPTGACGTGVSATTTYDVWFTFVATSTTHAVTISSLGNNLSTATTYVQMLSSSTNNCAGVLASLGCQPVSTTGGRLSLTTLTIGNTYYVRVYVTSNPTASSTSGWNFNICLQEPPVNDLCTGAITLTPGATCNSISGTLDLATPTVSALTGCVAAGTYYDVWYSFVATAASHTITLGSIGSSFTAQRIQIFSGICAALVPVGCASTYTLTQGGLLIGTTYYVRIANFGVNPSGTGTVANFNICITAAAAAPSNDLCTGATMLTSGTTCSNIAGTLVNATATAGLPGCGNASSPEVWYSFVAQTAYPSIRLDNIGGNLLTASPRIQLLTFSGGCGGIATSLACLTVAASPTTLNTATTPGGAGLIVGNTYYIRITTNTNMAPPAGGTYGFTICVTDPVATASAILDYSKSYVNLSDTATGGTIDPGDILEIRATLVVRPNGGGIRFIDSVAYYDTLKAGGGLHYYDSIALRTNEGKRYKYFTESNADSDAGWMIAGGVGTDTAIQINMGTGASRTARGTLNSASVPRFNTGTSANCIILATYRVVVNASYGQTINFGGGAFSYRDQTTGVYSTIQFPPDSIMIFQSPGSCPNSVSQTNILGDESNGTFGTGTTQNRGTSPNTNYLYTPFNTSTPQDYYYGIPNNTSALGSTNQLLTKSNAARVHGVWDISGDHTGATNLTKGNLPASPGSSGGYMLAINASYKTDIAFDFNVSGACPDTYYEISAWFKNICYKCGCDSLGRFSSNGSYLPTGPGDSTGVRPNIAIAIDGVDYYTTGNLRYMGLGGTQTGSDTLNQWVQRAFVYKTGPSQTSFTMSLRNNAPGGGGNDWAIDDIALKTCSPELDLLPGPNPFLCDSNLVEMSTVVRSFYNNYNHYRWEKSIDGGVTWTSTGIGGTASPTWNGSEYEYTVDYPPFIGYYSDSGSVYRVAVATSASNLASSTCKFNETAEITLNVDPCGFLLNNDILSFRGRNENNQAVLYLNTSKETTPVTYEIQRSKDGSYFEKIGELVGFKHPDAENNSYRFTDPELLDNTISYYRIKAINTQDNKFKYSKVIQLIGDKAGLQIESLINPFNSNVKFDLISGDDGLVHVDILDEYQHKVKVASYNLVEGRNRINIDNTENLPAGFYILRVTSNNNVINRKIIKRG